LTVAGKADSFIALRPQYVDNSEKRRICMKIAILASVAVAIFASGMQARADDYPSKPIRILVGFAPGGGTDVTTRVLAPGIGKRLGQTIIVENHAGAGGNIAAEIVAKAAPDGYTLLMGTIAALAINPSLYSKSTLDPLRDLAPITQTVSLANIVAAHPSLPVKSLRDLIALAREKPDSISYGSSGAGSAGHLAGELFKSMAQVKLVHVPYKGGAPAMADLISGHVNLNFAAAADAIAQSKAGTIRALAVTTPFRIADLPDVPTVEEDAGLKGYQAINWYGLTGPAKLPRALLDRIFTATVETLKDSDARTRLLSSGLQPAPSKTPEEFTEFIRAEGVKWAKVVKESGAKAD
jgi:tripartite-type tricarboxylate transporter receptor subunit TctC